MALVEGSLRCLEEEARGGRGKVAGLEFQLGGRIHAEHAEGLGALPAVGGGFGNGLIERTQGGSWRNAAQEIGGIFRSAAKLSEALSGSVPEIRAREAIHRFIVETAGVIGIACAFGVAAHPVESVDGIG